MIYKAPKSQKKIRAHKRIRAQNHQTSSLPWSTPFFINANRHRLS